MVFAKRNVSQSLNGILRSNDIVAKTISGILREAHGEGEMCRLDSRFKHVKPNKLVGWTMGNQWG